MNKNFIDFVKYAVSKKIYTTTSTNAHFLTDDLSKQIVESGLDSIIISMDGSTQEAYESYRIGGELEKVKQGITNLVSWKKNLESSKPHIVLQFLVLKTNEHQIDEIKQFAKQNGIDELQLKTAQIYDFENGSPLIPSNTKYSRYLRQTDGKYKIKKKLSNHCFRMWSSCVITWDGDVLPCCFDKDANYKKGNVAKQDFLTIWKNSNYNSFRKKVFKNRSSIDICCNCTE